MTALAEMPRHHHALYHTDTIGHTAGIDIIQSVPCGTCGQTGGAYTLDGTRHYTCCYYDPLVWAT